MTPEAALAEVAVNFKLTALTVEPKGIEDRSNEIQPLLMGALLSTIKFPSDFVPLAETKPEFNEPMEPVQLMVTVWPVEANAVNSNVTTAKK